MAKKNTAPVNPAILQWAIDDLNVPVEKVAKGAGVKPERVEEWLRGTCAPTYKQAENLAYKVFKKPLAIFFMDEIPAHLSVKKKFRSLPDTIFNEITYKTRLAINQADYYGSVLKNLYIKNPSDEPAFKTIKAGLYISPVELAFQLRQKFAIDHNRQKSFKGDGYKAFNYYRGALEKGGIYTFQLKLKGERAFCLLDEEFPVIVLNSSDSIFSKIFSLFHELIHILINKDDVFMEEEPDFYLNDPEEVYCNKTASEILVPEGEFKELYITGGAVPDESFVSKIAGNYAVSREVILRKLLDLQYIGSNDYSRYKKHYDELFHSKKKKGNADYYAAKLSSLGRTYTAKVIDEYRQGAISDTQVSDYLGIKYSNLNKVESELYI